MNAAISISYPGDHRKGDGQILNGAEHAEMLSLIVKRYRSEVDWPIFICCTSFDGFTPYTRVGDARERALLWELFAMPKVWFVTVPENPGHLEGSTWSIRQGVEAAWALKINYLVHACEDVVPGKFITKNLVQRMKDEGLIYIGEPWRNSWDCQLSTQFFGCNVRWFYEHFKGRGEYGLLVESYMGNKVLGWENIAMINRCYKHTHTPSEFKKFLEE